MVSKEHPARGTHNSMEFSLSSASRGSIPMLEYTYTFILGRADLYSQYTLTRGRCTVPYYI
jgi:hypothetical protein